MGLRSILRTYLLIEGYLTTGVYRSGLRNLKEFSSKGRVKARLFRSLRVRAVRVVDGGIK